MNKKGNYTLLSASQARVAVGRVYWVEFDKGGNWKQTGTRAHDAPGSSSSFDSHLFPLPYASLLTRSVPHRCTSDARTQASYLLSTGHIGADARAHPHTNARDRPTDTLKVPPPTVNSSNRIALSLSRSTSLYPSLSIANRTLSPSLSHARSPRSLEDSRYSLADNLAELVNIVEENLVVRHSDDEEEVEGVDLGARNLHAPGDASRLRERVIIRSACGYAPFSLAPVVVPKSTTSLSSCRRRCVVVFVSRGVRAPWA